MQASFDPLWRRLLDGGVRRRPARRYLAELKDHLDDLIAEERRAMGDPQLAETRALSRLGSFEMLADAMIERREFRTWGARAPFATYLLAPIGALAASVALGAAVVVLAAQRSHVAGSDAPAWLGGLAGFVIVCTQTVLPVLLAWALGLVAFRNRSPALWPICGIVALAVLGTSVHLGLTLPTATTHGEVGISGEFGDSPAQVTAFAGLLALAALPYAGLLLWRAARDRQAA